MRASVWVFVAACHAPSGAAPPDASPDAAVDASADAAAPPPDPWSAPLGAALAGVTLADGWTDLRAMLAPLAIDGGWTDSMFATPDGLHLRFAYQPLDFSDFFLSGGATQTITGPELAGETATTFKLFDATLTAAGWTIAYDPINAGDITEASPAANASGDLVVFTEFLPQSQLYYASYANGTWSPAAAVSIGFGTCNDDNAKIIGELAGSVAIYFESNRGTPCAQRTLYTTTYASGVFAPVTELAGIATADSDDSQPFLDGATLYFTSSRDTGYGVFTADAQPDGSFANVHAIATPTTTAAMYAGNVTLIGEASVVDTTEGELLYMMCGVAANLHGGNTYGDADHVALVPCVARRPKT